MSVVELLREFTTKVVIVDDGYKEVDLTMIDGEDFQEFYEFVLQEDRWERLKSDIFSGFPDLEPDGLIANEAAIRAAWDFYHGSEENSHECLTIVFRQLLSSVGTKIAPLKPLVRYLEKDLKLEVKRFSTVEAASKDIKSCRLLFLDFYLENGSAEDMLQKIEAHKDLLSGKVEGDDSLRFVFLMSTQLPPTRILDRFRRTTNLRAALFSPVDKAVLRPDWLASELATRVDRYKDVLRVELFLDAFKQAINFSASSLLEDISALELHDLSILKSMRLYEEQESYAEYLGWLFSEALSAKIRNYHALSSAAHGVNSISLTPFSGMLEPRSLLFKLYSEIAFSYVEEGVEPRQIHFGDIYCAKKLVRNMKRSDLRKRVSARDANGLLFNKDRRTADNQALVEAKVQGNADQVVLVISPACDLVRCPSSSYQVTCVRGVIEHTVPRLADLFDKNHLFGKNKHLMRIGYNGVESYALINWMPKEVVTFPVSELRNKTLYAKRARMNELFCHEVKEETLRVLGRVGVPVDPSFVVPLGAALTFKAAGRPVKLFLAPAESLISAVRVAGNNSNDRKIVFTSDFKAWICRELRREFDEDIPKGIKAILSLFEENSSVEFVAKKTEQPLTKQGLGKLIYMDSYVEDLCVNDLGIYVFPWE